MKRITSSPTLAVVLAVVLAVALLPAGCRSGKEKPEDHDEPGHEESEKEEQERGPHGGRMFREGTLAAEVSIYEKGVPPRFRIHFTEKGKPLGPENGSAKATITRLGGRVDKLSFAPEAGYLVSDGVVEEPHSFDTVIEASVGERQFRWAWSQEEGRIEMSDEQVAGSKIGIATAGPQEIRVSLELPGETKLNADRVAHITARLPGVVTGVSKNLGDPVKKGETLAYLESRDLADARRELLETHGRLRFARDAHAREASLLEKGISSEAEVQGKKRDLDQAGLEHSSASQKLAALGVSQAARDELVASPATSLNRLALKAPFDGVVIEKEVSVGQAVGAEAHLFTVADLSSLWVDVTVYAKDLPLVEAGQKVVVRSADLQAEIEGTIAHLGAVIEPGTRSTSARIVLPNRDGKWRAGLFVTTKIVRERVSVPVAVRRDALQTFRDWKVVFGRFGNFFEVRPLELGREDEEWVEVLSGISAGERYATENSFVIKADVGKSGASHDH